MTDTQWVLISTDEEAMLERFNDSVNVREQRWAAEHKQLDHAATDEGATHFAESPPLLGELILAGCA